jgi:DMSO/TMAO reductase YedYZ molybdopterin-dependent catalytic subunit
MRNFPRKSSRYVGVLYRSSFHRIVEKNSDGTQRHFDCPKMLQLKFGHDRTIMPSSDRSSRQSRDSIRMSLPSRRRFLKGLGGVGLASVLGDPPRAATDDLQLPFANGRRLLASNFPQKGSMILQRTRPPLLETPFDVFDRGVFTPNDRFYVRWHLANIPTVVDPVTFRLKIHGHVKRPLALTLSDLVRQFASTEYAAVNQCSGNSRGFFQPRVAGGQWANGAMGNALWRGVAVKALLERAGVKAGAIQVRFNGLDTGILAQTPDFMKSLAIDHSLDGEVMIAYAMNGERMPLLNGYPLRLVVPGWYATYWVKMLDDIEVLDKPDENFWMSRAYLIPDTPRADITPGQQGVKTVPISRMLPRAFFTNIADSARVNVGETTQLRGIAMGGDTAVARVLFSADSGATWQDAELGTDHGKYSFRAWQFAYRPLAQGQQILKVRTVNRAGESQPDRPNWNGAGFMRNVVETVTVNLV